MSAVSHVAGKEEEIGFLSAGHPDLDPKNSPLINKNAAWSELIAMCMLRGKSEENARKFCQAQYKVLFGEFCHKKFNWADAGAATGNKEFALKIRRQVAHYALKNGRGKKRREAYG